MANKIVLKKSSVVGKVPTTSDLDYGEVALNYADGRLYFKTSSNTINYFTTSSGDVGTITTGTWNANVIQIAYGGTGASTAAGARNNLLPSQGGNSGKYLSTDGTNVFWSTVSGSQSNTGPVNEITMYSDTFTGDGSTVNYTLSIVPPNENSLIISLNGVVQDPATYSLSGAVLTFSTAPASGDNIDVRTIKVLVTDVGLKDFVKYRYAITSTTSTLSGVDANGNTLEYNPGKLDVFQNGVRLVGGIDYTAANGTSVTFDTALANGDMVEIISFYAAYLLDSPIIKDTEALVTTAANQTVDSFAATEFRTAKYLIQAIANGEVHSTEVILTHDNTDVFVAEYGTLYSGAAPLITVTAAKEGTNINLKVTPVNANTTIDFARTALIARTL